MAGDATGVGIIVTAEGPVRIVAASGRVDHTNAETFAAGLLAAAAEVGASGGLIVDLGGLGFISSAGLRALMQARKALVPVGGRMVVTGLTGVVGVVFETAKLATLVETAADCPSALSRFRAG